MSVLFVQNLEKQYCCLFFPNFAHQIITSIDYAEREHGRLRRDLSVCSRSLRAFAPAWELEKILTVELCAESFGGRELRSIRSVVRNLHSTCYELMRQKYSCSQRWRRFSSSQTPIRESFRARKWTKLVDFGRCWGWYAREWLWSFFEWSTEDPRYRSVLSGCWGPCA